ncbi:phosphate ABC transporter ATP-binding protein [candidate division WOR-3 bacterium]|nr:phosphate ABC transporter ATP-binding protein [candidate division WOR-3 bacterium]
MESKILNSVDFSLFYGETKALDKINIEIPAGKVTAIMGPSGCGKTTFIRAINRMHEIDSNVRREGEIFLHGKEIHSLDPIGLRRKIGMVFQKPNPFPTMNIYDNVIAGYKLGGIRLSRTERDLIVEDSLKKAALWNEVKDNLYKRGTFLSGGQQQRLCIARSLALKPEILLLDEPTSALDPKSTAKIEELIVEMKEYVTLLLVTHNMSQAARVSDLTAFFFLGELVEFGKTEKMFTSPDDKKTEEYLTGKFS